ncbi:MAG: ECF transporter S component [Actinomycetes bacterium]
MTPPALRLRPRTAVALGLSSAVGILAFCWPLLVTSTSPLSHSTDAPWVFGALVVLVLTVVLAEISEGGMDAKAVALLGVLAAVGAALRPVGAGTAGLEPVFFLLLPAGRVLGRGFGFVLGAVTLAVSAVLTGGVGPWLPFQMLGAAWMGFGAGCLPRTSGRVEVALLAGYGVLAGWLYGLVLNLSFWPFAITQGSSVSFVPGDAVSANLARLLAFSLATSLGWDLMRGLTIAALMLLAGRPVLAALRRAASRARFEAAPQFRPADPVLR